MDEKDDKENEFPPEFAHLGEMLDKAEEQIRQIDEQIKNLPHDKGPAPQYNPPGFLRSRQTGSRDQNIDRLEKKKAQIKADTFSNIEKESRRADAKTAKNIQNVALTRLYRDQLKKINTVERQKLKSQEKDIETSQDYAATQLGKGLDSKGMEQKNEAPQPTDAQPSRQENMSFSTSLRFSQTLNYTISLEKTDPSPESPNNPPSPQKDQDDIDKD